MEANISREDEEIIEHINDLMGRMFTMSEIASIPIRDEVIDTINTYREELESGLIDLREFKSELDSMPDFSERLARSPLLRQSYSDMVSMIDQWESVIS